MVTPFVLGIIGDSGSGKSTVAQAVTVLLGADRVADLRLDDYHRFTREERRERGVTALNPIVHNLPLMREHLQLLRRGRPIRNRSYQHADGSFGPIRTIEPREVVLALGLMGYPNQDMRSLYDLTVFLEPEPELLFRWKLRRDTLSRGYTEAEVLKHIAKHLLDAKEFVLPQAQHADVVVRHELPDPEAPDAEVRTSLQLRVPDSARLRVREAVSELGAGAAEWEEHEEHAVFRPSPDLPLAEVDRWGAELFGATYDADRVGRYRNEAGAPWRRAPLAVVEVTIALLVEGAR